MTFRQEVFSRGTLITSLHLSPGTSSPTGRPSSCRRSSTAWSAPRRWSSADRTSTRTWRSAFYSFYESLWFPDPTISFRKEAFCTLGQVAPLKIRLSKLPRSVNVNKFLSSRFMLQFEMKKPPSSWIRFESFWKICWGHLRRCYIRSKAR